MIGKAAIKVAGGKLLKAQVDYDGKTVKKAKLSGDFFIYPEETIERLEERLKGAKLSEVSGIVESELSAARLYGVDPASIVKAVKEAAGGI